MTAIGEVMKSNIKRIGADMASQAGRRQEPDQGDVGQYSPRNDKDPSGFEGLRDRQA